MERVKLFVFYQLMAFQSLRNPPDGRLMIQLAQEGRGERDRKASMEAIFGLGQKVAPKNDNCADIRRDEKVD